jgi:hypothetical protein
MKLQLNFQNEYVIYIGYECCLLNYYSSMFFFFSKIIYLNLLIIYFTKRYLFHLSDDKYQDFFGIY